ncbi:Uncharacterised protein [Helicobacter muridarum]|uniref:Uncharacterized protein n=1 Tax=Helicobacter muridarum TaxID=216 RepID=A0A377PUS2_9HELI|nr:Uncharacterised protein [Helicobacter muridarum]
MGGMGIVPLYVPEKSLKIHLCIFIIFMLKAFVFIFVCLDLRLMVCFVSLSG